jgi:hypothetical protein
MNESQRVLIAITALLGAMATLAILSWPKKARGVELCFLAPQGIGEWHYRTKVGGRPERCYYEGTRMKPRRELYWAEAPAIPPMSIMTTPEPEPGEFELRWKGNTQ